MLSHSNFTENFPGDDNGTDVVDGGTLVPSPREMSGFAFACLMIFWLCVIMLCCAGFASSAGGFDHPDASWYCEPKPRPPRQEQQQQQQQEQQQPLVTFSSSV